MCNRLCWKKVSISRHWHLAPPPPLARHLTFDCAQYLWRVKKKKNCDAVLLPSPRRRSAPSFAPPPPPKNNNKSTKQKRLCYATDPNTTVFVSVCAYNLAYKGIRKPLVVPSFQPVLHYWCNKCCGMYYPLCGMMHIKEPLLLIGKSSPCDGSGFPLAIWVVLYHMYDAI